MAPYGGDSGRGSLRARPLRHPIRPYNPFGGRFANPTHTPPHQPGPPGPVGSPWDSDPILQMIKAQSEKDISYAQGNELAQRNRALVQYGYDPSLSSLYGDANTTLAAKNNPFSVLAQLLSAHQLQQKGINEDKNKQNLFYSGSRDTALAKEGIDYLGNLSSADATLRNLLHGYQTDLAGATGSAQHDVIQGTTDAYNRYLQTALTYGGSFDNGVAPKGGRHASPTRVRRNRYHYG